MLLLLGMKICRYEELEARKRSGAQNRGGSLCKSIRCSLNSYVICQKGRAGPPLVHAFDYRRGLFTGAWGLSSRFYEGTIYKRRNAT
jgi:hypothetical protein